MKLEYKFNDPTLLDTALTHPSLTKNKNITSYERLEFLGDSVLNLALAEELFKKLPDLDEGKLSQVLANLVNTQTLAEIAFDLGIGNVLKMDIGEEKSGGRTKVKNLENSLEALIGAIYLDSNSSLDVIRTIIIPWWSKYLDDANYVNKRDAKSTLQEFAQKLGKSIPVYTLLSESGFAHEKVFTIEVSVADYGAASASGTSRKKAEQLAAEILLNQIESSTKSEN